MLWLILAFVVLVLITVWATWTAMRIERLDARVDAAWQSLDAALVRRGAALSQAAGERGAVGDAVHRALRTARADRSEAENALSRVIGGMPRQDIGEALSEACIQVRIARTFYNDGVRAAQSLRAQRLPRLLRLGRRVAVPPYFDIDDDAGTDRSP